jgi:hypothetical protein
LWVPGAQLERIFALVYLLYLDRISDGFKILYHGLTTEEKENRKKGKKKTKETSGLTRRK